MGRDIPIGLLPLGTANNVARTLASFGCEGPRISTSASLSAKDYDIGLAKGDGADTVFLESAGFGLLAHLITVMASDKKGTFIFSSRG